MVAGGSVCGGSVVAGGSVTTGAVVIGDAVTGSVTGGAVVRACVTGAVWAGSSETGGGVGSLTGAQAASSRARTRESKIGFIIISTGDTGFFHGAASLPGNAISSEDAADRGQEFIGSIIAEKRADVKRKFVNSFFFSTLFEWRRERKTGDIPE